MTVLFYGLSVLFGALGVVLLWFSGRVHGRRPARSSEVPAPPEEALSGGELVQRERDDLRRQLDVTDKDLTEARSRLTDMRRKLAKAEERTPVFSIYHLKDSLSQLAQSEVNEIVGGLGSASKGDTEEGLLDELYPTPAYTPRLAHRDDETSGFTDCLRKIAGEPLKAVGVGMICVDVQGRVEFLNGVAERLTGWRSAQAAGRPVDSVFCTGEEWSAYPSRISGDDLKGVAMTGSGSESTFLIHRRGHRLAVEWADARITDRSGKKEMRVIVISDLSEKRLMTLHMARQASHDALTGLLNRNMLTQHLTRCVEKERPFVLCHLDLDHFKLVNDTCGHDAGDALLQWVSAIIREGTGAEDVLARLGADEFGVLFNGLGVKQAGEAVEELRAKLKAFSFSWNDISFSVGFCCGLAAGEGGSVPGEVLFAAEHACSRAKQLGGGSTFLHRSTDLEMRRRKKDAARAVMMKRDLKDDRFELFYQPIRPTTWRGEPGAPAHFEVLLRMVGEGGKLQSPGEVIRAAEEYGGMDALDRWVVRNCLKRLAAAPPENLGGIDVCSVNLSAASLRNGDLLEYIQEQFAEYGLPPGMVCFEITETAAVRQLGKAQWLMEGLRAIGCKFALDDFGTGMASYGYLKDLPVDFLKIDGVFIRDLAKNALNRAIVESINHIGHFLGIKTVAEVVGSEAVWKELSKIGVDYGQGYWLGRPRPLTERIGAGEWTGVFPAADVAKKGASRRRTWARGI